MNNLDKQYTALLQDILDNGVEKKDRTGTGTISVFGRQIRHKMSEGFPLLTTKKMGWKQIVTELLWFLRGDTNIKYLVDNNCHIWDGDAYKRYESTPIDEVSENHKYKLPNFKGGEVLYKPNDYVHYTKEEFINKIKTDDEFAEKWGELGPVYGKQWRRWDKHNWIGGDWNPKHDLGNFKVEQIDQIANSINLLKTDPDSRRNRVNAWNVGELDQMVLPPCHTDFQFYTRELSLDERRKIVLEGDPYGIQSTDNWTQQQLEDCKKQLDEWNTPTRAISLMWNQRSVDTFLGLPFNIASYGLLLEIIAKAVNMVPDELIGNLGDVHLYSNHIEQAKEQIGRLSWEERKEFLSKEQLITFGDISPFTDKMIHWWLDCSNIPYSKRMPYSLPKIWINNLRSDSNSIINDVTKWSHEDFKLENYQSHPAIKAPLSN